MSTITTLTNTSMLSTSGSSSRSGEEVPPEVQEVVAVKPCVPDYTDEQLELLVEKVKSFTTVFDLRDDDWTSDVQNVIKDYFLNRSAEVLSIYFDDITLKAALGFPTVPVKDMTYFLKDCTDTVSPENFNEIITFGTTNDSIEGTMLSVVEHVYAPVFFNETSWPESVKSDFCTKMHAFLANLTDQHYKMLGITVIYIPQEGLNLSVEEASKDMELLRRLEGIVVHWIWQIRGALDDQNQPTSAEMLCPIDEYEFWKYRYKNLAGLNFQLQEKTVKQICDILLMSHSVYIRQFLTLVEEAEEGMQEAKSNIEFLQILKEHCEKLDKTLLPANIPDIIPILLQNIRVIWVNSPYFNSREKLSALCQLISNQIILQCTGSVNLESVFQGNTRAGIEMFQNIIECCLKYRLLYDKIAETHSKFSHIPWNLDNDSIFNHVDSFVQRCRDMIEVCEVMIVFGRMDEMENVPKPRFGGTRGEEFENICEKVEKTFAENLQAIRDVQQNILDVRATAWYDGILRFRGQMKDIEVILGNLMVSVFEQVENLEEGVHALQAFYHYSKRDALRPLYNQKTAAVYQLFNTEIQEAKKHLVEEKSCCPAGLPQFAGQALMTRLKKRHMTKLMKILDDSQWMPPCAMGDEVRVDYEKLIISMEDIVRHLYQKWNDTMDTNISARLDRPLMIRSHTRPGLLESNFDRIILNVCHEARVWERLKYEVPAVIQSVYNKWDQLKLKYETVLTIVMDYNQVIEALSDEERVLFRELIKVCDKKINPGLLKIKWNTDVSELYISDCFLCISELHDFVNDFKNCNLEIVSICEAICDTPLIHVDATYVYELKELENHLSKFREEAVVKILFHYEHIIQCVVTVYDGFEQYIPMMGKHWDLYICKMDGVIGDALKQCVRSSLQIMLDALHGDGTTGSTQILKLSASLKNCAVSFEPSLTAVTSFIAHILRDIVDCIVSIPRLVEKFKVTSYSMQAFWVVVEQDDECKQLQDLIMQEMAANMNQIQNYLKTWEQFRDLWEVNTDVFITKYEDLKPSVSSFDRDIGRYNEIANNVQMQESVSPVHFIIINSMQLKDAIVEHCYLWQDKLAKLLLRLTYNKIRDSYCYNSENTENVLMIPQSLKELQEAIAVHRKLVYEIPEREATFPVIKDQYGILLKYNVNVTEDIVDLLNHLDDDWKKFLNLLEESEKQLQRGKVRFQTWMLNQSEILLKEEANLLATFFASGPYGSDWKAEEALAYIYSVRDQQNALRKREGQLREDIGIFNISLPDSADLTRLVKELDDLEVVWELTVEWDTAWELYKTGEFWTTDIKEMEDNVQTMFHKLTHLFHELKHKNWEILEHTYSRVDAFRRTLQLVPAMKNPSMRERHWESVKKVIDRDFDQNSSDLTLEAIIAMKMQNYAKEINEVSNAASMELAVEMDLKAIAEVWEHMPLELVPHRQGTYRLKTVDEVLQTLEDHQVQLGTMKSKKFVEPFINEVDYWKSAFSVITAVLELMLVVQIEFLHLENIFLDEDIRQQLPIESGDFDKITLEWKEITSCLHKDRKALSVVHYPRLHDRLNSLKERLEHIHTALKSYLETKRHIFPRFCFMSNSDMLEVLGQSKRPENVQPHLKKCFDNINRIKVVKNVVANKWEGQGMISADGEYVEFSSVFALEGPVDGWLSVVEDSMHVTLRDQLKLCQISLRKNLIKRDKWIKEWPGQLCITSSQIQWTTDCTKALIQCKQLETRKPLKDLRKKQNQLLSKFSDALQGTLTKVQRLKFVSLVTIGIHARDVVDKMYKSNCTEMSSFEWLSQLRFYWDRDIDDCIVRQTHTYFVYGYEYLGNSGRLVITPLTERCYITLTTALHLHRGASAKGPAGSGKTETIKDLGKGLGRYVIVVNSSEGIDYMSVGRMFSGLAQTGGWGCFDDFDRIDIEVLSVIAQQILCILSALAERTKSFVFEGQEINLVLSCGIFITMNPGCAGRTELPDNLKSMFRPVSMIVPDTALIAEIVLFGEGFQDTHLLAKKVCTMYYLAAQQLSKQDHYDFGLRGMITLLRYAGRKRHAYSKLPDDEIILLAMKDMNVAKLTADDLPLFNGIISDLFPGTEIPVIDNEDLTAAVQAQFLEQGLQYIKTSAVKVIQLYETKNSHHSVMIVGRTGAGKTVTWRTLQRSLIHLNKEGKAGFSAVRDYPISPKALNLHELYGEFSLNTHEWLDGVLSSVMRETCADEQPDEKWIVFDGPVDAVWIENMNSLMDDNKVLTLINSERIIMPEQVSLLFEVEDLAAASPATVSRCGMVYCDYKDLGWRPYVDSWLLRQQDKGTLYVETMKEYFNHYVDVILQYKRLNCQETFHAVELSSVMSLCKLLECLAVKQNGLDTRDEDSFRTMSKMWFLFCMIWSVCASVDENGHKKLDNIIREIESIFPIKGTVYEYFVDVGSKSFMSWEVKLSDQWKYNKELPFFKITVPTVDTVRCQYVLSALLSNNYPCLLSGPVGAGKTSAAQTVLESLDVTKYSILTINISAQTSSNSVQDIIEKSVEKRMKGVYVPPGGKTMITFIDDLNMSAKENSGAQPPLELIRQWIDYGFWYDRCQQTRTFVKSMLLMAAMRPPGGGRNEVSNRLLSRFNVINMSFPSETQIGQIFGTLLKQHVADFEEEVRLIARPVTAATIDLYCAVIINMLPTPSKMHYQFNLRDISKVFQGLLRSHRKYQNTQPAMLRLWIHECYRVFSDRLIDEKDEEWFLNQMNVQLGKHFDLTLHNLCPGNECPVFGNFLNPWKIYEDLVDYGKLRKYLEEQMEKYNITAGVVHLDIVLFKDIIIHICRVIRVISQPQGNMLLIGIGGSGRQSLSRMAAHICEHNTFQITVTKEYRVQEFREDLKTLYRTTGIDYKATSFLFSDTQITDEAFLEIISNILNSGEVTDLYKAHEFEEIKSALLPVALKECVAPTNETMRKLLMDRVRTNLHVILCMTPIGNAFRNRIRLYPALINCTAIDWFRDWPREALLEVADKYLANVNILETISEGQKKPVGEVEYAATEKKLRASIALIFATIHDLVTECSRKMLVEFRRHNYVTPTNYLDLVAGYKTMLEEKRRFMSSGANKLRNSLFKIEDTKREVETMRVELEEAQVKVNEYQQHCLQCLVKTVTQKREADEQQKIVAARSVKINEEEITCKKLADVVEADLKEAMPALEAAMKALEALNKEDLAEVKSFGRPPAAVEMVMEAVMVFKQVEPTWAEAKRQLEDPSFLLQLQDFDKDHISDRTLKKISTYTTNEEFDPEKFGVVSLAAKFLCLWVIAMEKYGKIYRVVAPKRVKLEEAQEALREKRASLAAAQAKFLELNLYLDHLQKEYEKKLQQKEELKKKAETLGQRLERAAQLVEGFAGECEQWKQTVENLDTQYEYLLGDCILAAGFISYMGPFTSTYRDELVKSWKKCVLEEEVPCSQDFSVITFLSDPTTVTEWNIQGLPTDGFSTENGIIVTQGTRWPLLIDPHCQGMKWLKNFAKKLDLKVTDFDLPDYMNVIEHAIECGKAVLLQNVREQLDPSLTPVLNKAMIKQGGQMLINLGDSVVQYNENFRFYITTKIGNPHYAPEVTMKTTVVNFAVTQEGLEAQLLSTVVRKERPQLQEQKDGLVSAIAAAKRQLLGLEDELLRLFETKGSLLDDLGLLITLQNSKTTAAAITQQLSVAETTKVEVDNAREVYHACAERASILFFVLNDMSQIDPIYQFSLDVYISLFVLSIEKSPKCQNFEDRIMALNDYHTYSVYRNTCQGLFERHKLLFSFHMCVQIIKKKISAADYNFFLKGGAVIDREDQIDTQCPDWLPDFAWDNITELDKLEGFHGVMSSFVLYQRDWQLWYASKEPENVPLVGEWKEICTEFQSMLFVRAVRPDRISFCVRKFIVNNLGHHFVEPPVLDVKAVLEDSTPWSPLIFMLSPGDDPTSALIHLAHSCEMSANFHIISLGQGQAPIATQLIQQGATEGYWIFLANCHLLRSWMPKLDTIVDSLQTSQVNKRFRLWMSLSPFSEFPISILQAGIKMTAEPPKGIRSNLKRLYQSVSEDQFSTCKNQSKYHKLLFCLSFFHSVISERKKFQQLGWNIIYSFSDSDFELSVNLLSFYLDKYVETPWDALKYLIAGITYGGHVADDWDRRLLTTYINQYFCEDTLQVNLYRLSSLPAYYVPQDGSLQSYNDYITILPTVDQPDVFGQHCNADITSLMIESRILCETLMSLQVQHSASEGESKENKVMQLATEVLSKIPKCIDYENAEKLIGADKKPLDIVLLQEIVHYNTLLAEIRTSLLDLQRGIKGLVVMSFELEHIFLCIYEGRVPAAWLKAYPSLKQLGSWTQDLVLRVQHFSDWAATTHPPVLFWLAACTFPTRFLTAILQTAAKHLNVSVDSLCWEFAVLTVDENAIVELPQAGIYIRGLFLEGAAWDKGNACLIEPQPMQLVCAMPVIHFKPVKQGKKVKSKGKYVCPCYYNPQRCSEQGRQAFVLAVELGSGKKNSDFWIKRGTALLLSIMVGMWAPEPPQEPYNENLSTSAAGVIVIEQDSSDSEDDNPGYGGYQLLAQAPHDLPSSGNEDTDDSESAGDFPASFEADGMLPAAIDTDDSGASHMASDQCNFENERCAELREVWSGSSNGDSIEMGNERAEEVRAAMANFALPVSAIPEWASAVPEEQWKEQLLDRIQKLQQQQGDRQPKT